MPCHAHLLTDLLRREWGFEGIVVSDYEGVVGLHAAHHTAASRAEAGIQALQAGLDVELPNGGALRAALSDGRLTDDQLDEAVRRVLRLKIELGLFEKPYVEAAAAGRRVRQPASVALSRQAAEQGVVLLKNDGALPLGADVRKVALLGPVRDRVPLGGYTFRTRWASSWRSRSPRCTA